MADCFDQLAQRHVITAATAATVRRAVGFRNLVAHGYAGDDVAATYAASTVGLDDLDQFAREVQPGSHLDRAGRMTPYERSSFARRCAAREEGHGPPPGARCSCAAATAGGIVGAGRPRRVEPDGAAHGGRAGESLAAWNAGGG
jgi:hypothetical protein